MILNGHVSVLFTVGSAPGTLCAQVQLVGEDGTVYDEGPVTPLLAGHTLEYGPVRFAVQVEPQLGFSPTRPQSGPAAGAASKDATAGKIPSANAKK